jgi:hypothetical protein
LFIRKRIGLRSRGNDSGEKFLIWRYCDFGICGVVDYYELNLLKVFEELSLKKINYFSVNSRIEIKT